MAYATLKKIFHSQDASAARQLYEARSSSESALHWDFPVGKHTLFCLITPELVHLVERAHQLELRIQQTWFRLSGSARAHYIRSLLLDEVVSTNAIEGVHSTRRQVQEALEEKNRSSSGHRRFREMSHLYLAFIEGDAQLPASLQEIRELYDALMDGELKQRDKLDGELFRTDLVEIEDSTGKVIHRGFQPEEKIVQGLEKFLETMSDQDSSALVNAVIAHFMFESIHPFYDGNGRTGRYLLGLHLSRLLSTPTALTLSRTLNEERSQYYRAFSDVETPLNRGDGTPFVLTLLTLISQAQERLNEDLEVRLHLLSSLKEVVDRLIEDAYSSLKDTHLKILFLLGQVQLFGSGAGILVAEVADYVTLSNSQTRKYLLTLEEADLVETTSSRPLRFILSPAGEELLDLTAP